MSKNKGHELLAKTGLQMSDGKPIFILYRIVPTKTGFDFYRDIACLEDKTPLEFKTNPKESVGGVLGFK